MNWLNFFKQKLSNSTLIKNGLWGVTASLIQTIFISLFFVILARQFSSSDFAEFLIASTIYQVLVAFSSLGLGQWFIREFDNQTDQENFTRKFIKVQAGLGTVFYIINIVAVMAIYPDSQIRILAVILGTNIIFDNIINAIKSLNIAEFTQNKTFRILIIDGVLRLALGIIIIFQPISIVLLSVLSILVRFLTCNLFIRMGSSDALSIRSIFTVKVYWEDLKEQILINWKFAIIGSISIIYWRLSNIIIAKNLTLQDVANYEISFRIFSIAMILPTLASATVYSQFVKLNNLKDSEQKNIFYKNVIYLYTVFALISYAFIYSFAEILVPIAFGHQYIDAITCLKEMFLTVLLAPTALLQATLIVSIKAEKTDMILNIISLLVNVLISLIGLHYIKSLTVINYSIFFSFFIFHLAQSFFLIKKGITTLVSVITHYAILLIFVVAYHYLSETVNRYILFIVTSTVALGYLARFFIKKQSLNLT